MDRFLAYSPGEVIYFIYNKRIIKREIKKVFINEVMNKHYQDQTKTTIKYKVYHVGNEISHDVAALSKEKLKEKLFS